MGCGLMMKQNDKQRFSPLAVTVQSCGLMMKQNDKQREGADSSCRQVVV